jgi:hypothetical protein
MLQSQTPIPKITDIKATSEVMSFSIIFTTKLIKKGVVKTNKTKPKLFLKVSHPKLNAFL